MKMLEAMRDTVALMDRRLADLPETQKNIDRFAALNEDLRPLHIENMLRIMESGINPQDTEAGFSEGKMGRWLGWAQAAVVGMGVADLDDMKAINKKWTDHD